MNVQPRLSKRAQASVEADFENIREAFRLLGLINAEFVSDPMSVQCFDLRIVQRVKDCVEKRAQHVNAHPWMLGE